VKEVGIWKFSFLLLFSTFCLDTKGGKQEIKANPTAPPVWPASAQQQFDTLVILYGRRFCLGVLGHAFDLGD